MPPSPAKICEQITLPPLIKVGKLKKILTGYNNALFELLVTGFTDGFKIHSTIKTSEKVFPQNHKTAWDNPEAVQAKLNKELKKGRTKGSFKKTLSLILFVHPLGWYLKRK